MSTIGQFSSRNPTIKRILKEASELANSPSPDYHASPLESDLFEWHFTLRGPPAPSPFADGFYHGRIVLPPAYPLKPPSFRFLTPSGRFEVNREICLSISGHHEETWQPAWGIRTALVAIRSFMDTDAKGQLGGMDASREVRQRFQGRSREWKCGVCGKSNEEIMVEVEERVREAGEAERPEEAVPEGLRLAYREDLGENGSGQATPGASESDLKSSDQTSAETPAPMGSANGDVSTPALAAPRQRQIAQPVQPVPAPAPQQRRPARAQDEGIPPWIDKAILGVVIALLYLLWERFG